MEIFLVLVVKLTSITTKKTYFCFYIPTPFPITGGYGFLVTQGGCGWEKQLYAL